MIDVKSLKEGDLIIGNLAIRSKTGSGEGLREYSNKPGRFFVIRAGNSTGDITVKYWGGSKAPDKSSKIFSELKEGDVVEIKGRSNHDSFNKELVISINEEAKYGAPVDSLKKVKEGDFNAKDFLPSLPIEEIKSLQVKLKGLIENMENEHLKTLGLGFFSDEKFMRVFSLTPAARRHHHNYLGGLLEHTVNVSSLCNTIAKFYPMNTDLLIIGALLHDIGKTREYNVGASVEMTDEGRLIGHLPISADMVRNKISAIPEFPEGLRQKVIHMILAHHGELEKGSPKLPAFPEAMALFHADYMDAFVKNTIQELDSAADEPWIYSRSLGRFLTTK